MKSLSFDRVLTEELKCFWHKIWNLTIECPVASKAEAAATNFADGRIRKWQKSLCHVVLLPPLLVCTFSAIHFKLELSSVFGESSQSKTSLIIASKFHQAQRIFM